MIKYIKTRRITTKKGHLSQVIGKKQWYNRDIPPKGAKERGKRKKSFMVKASRSEDLSTPCLPRASTKLLAIRSLCRNLNLDRRKNRVNRKFQNRA